MLRGLDCIDYHADALKQVARGNKRADEGYDKFLDFPEVLSKREEEEREKMWRRERNINAAQA